MRKIKIIPRWKKTLRYAWSIRLAILAGLFSACEIVLPLFSDSLPRGLMAMLSGFAAMGAVISRFIVQKEIGHGNE
jgi:predicted benzoate:H+ symporter BenE